MNERILVVDDEKNMRFFLAKILEEEYLVLLAGDGEETIEKVIGEEPDLLLLDLKMPGMDGLEVIKRIKEIRPDLPIIVLSADEEIKTVVTVLQLGADDYLPKPSSVDEIKKTIRETLRKNKNVGSGLPLAMRVLVIQLSRKMINEGKKLEEAKKYFKRELLNKYRDYLAIS